MLWSHKHPLLNSNTTDNKDPTSYAQNILPKSVLHSYKTDERIIKNIMANNVQCNNKFNTLNFIPYYRSNTITELITRNNQGPPSYPTIEEN